MKKKPIVIAVANQKGGVAKTTTCESLAAAFGMLGKNVLVIDMDPQTNLSRHCSLNKALVDGTPDDFYTMYNVLSPTANPKIQLSGCIKHFDSFDIAPASAEMSSLDMEFTKKILTAMTHLRNSIQSDAAVQEHYDIILIDSGPTMNLLNTNVLVAADYCLIPTQCSVDGRDGVLAIYQSVMEVKQGFNPELSILGIAITQYEPRPIASRETKAEVLLMGTELQIPIFQPEIRKCAAVEKAHRAGKTVIAFDASSTAARDYADLAENIIHVIEKKGE